MPRYLYLLRHAQSLEKQPGEPDKERELTSVGVREALLIGNYLLRERTVLDQILTSTAKRADATARLVADSLKFDTDKISRIDALYDASTRTLFQFILQLDDQYHNILCVSHNPSISYLAESFTKAEIGDMPAGGLAIIKFNIGSWKEVSQGNGELQNFVYPKMLGEP